MLQKIDPKTLTMNPFTLIGDQWLLITAGTPEHCNTMTASWGGVGVLWAEPSATCYIRPQRYTKEFVDNSDYFTLCFFDESYRKALNLCGSTSGRDVDKIKECGFTVQAGAGNAPSIVSWGLSIPNHLDLYHLSGRAYAVFFICVLSYFLDAYHQCTSYLLPAST